MLEGYEQLRTRLESDSLVTAPPDQVSVPQLCRGVGGALEQRGAIDALCRQIAVKKRVLRFYLRDWTPPPRPEPLDPRERALLALWLGHFRLVPRAQVDQLGLSLKALNGALQSLELEGETEAREELSSWLEQLLP
ncbi:MAG: hypothetical protein AB7S38_38560 [Vulcanimicrobiota bacterium]